MMKCEIIRDLIPLYLDKVCSEDSRKLVEEHLAECSECRKYMKELETELEAVKQKKEEDLDEKRLLQEGAERMKEIGRKSIVDKMIIVDTLLNFLLIVTAVVLCKRQIDIEGADAGYYIAAMVFSFGFIIAFFVCDCITLVQKWKRRKMQTEWEYKQIPICESYAKISNRGKSNRCIYAGMCGLYIGIFTVWRNVFYLMHYGGCHRSE